MDLLDDCLQSMVAGGRLTADEYEHLAIPAWYRAEAEWLAPFGTSPMQLRHYDEVLLGDPLWATTGPETPGGSITSYATAVSAAIRVSFGPALLAVLDPGRRSAVETELFETRYPASTISGGESLFAWRLAVLATTRPPGS